MQRLTLKALESTYQYHQNRYQNLTTIDHSRWPELYAENLQYYLYGLRRTRPIYVRLSQRCAWVLLGRRQGLFYGADADDAVDYAQKIRRIYRKMKNHHLSQ